MHLIPFRIPIDVSPSLHPLIESFCSDALRIRGVVEATVKIDLIYLCRFLRHGGPFSSCVEFFSTISPESISLFLSEYAAENPLGSLRLMQISLRSFLRFAYRSSWVGNDLSALVPVQCIRRQGGVPRGLPDECIARLCSDIDRSTAVGLRDSAIMSLLATYGVRGIQIRQLRLDHIDWNNDRILFPAAKGGRAIEQHLVADAGNRVSEYIRRARPDSSHSAVFLMCTEPFRPIPSASYLSGVIRRRINQLGLILPEGVSHGTHGFRHAFACRMIGEIPFKELVDQLGHRDPASTLIYGKVDLDGLRQAALPWPGGEQ